MDNENNPVPSIDKLRQKIIKRLNDYDDLYHLKKDVKQLIISNFIIMEMQNLQNGVETNNEQPIKSKCSCIEPHYGFKEIAVCTDCNGIKDNEYWKRLG